MPYANILVPIDFSDASIHAIQAAVGIARLTGGRITLLHVGIVPYVYATELGLVGPAGTAYTQMNEEIHEAQRSQLDEVAARELPTDLTWSTILRDGYPAGEVLDQVQEGGHDLVVMGTHGRTGIKRALLGSVTERVVRECKVPVMVMH